MGQQHTTRELHDLLQAAEGMLMLAKTMEWHRTEKLLTERLAAFRGAGLDFEELAWEATSEYRADIAPHLAEEHRNRMTGVSALD